MPLTLRVHALSTDGRGIAREPEGRVVFVPGAWIGEEVEVGEPKRQGGVFVAELLRVVVASPHRRAPPCPYYGRCGGCQVQHVGEAAQRAARAEALLHNLRRIGKWDEESLRTAASVLKVHEADAWAYRQRVRWHVEVDAAGLARAGFRARGSHELVEIARCPITKAGLAESAAEAADFARARVPKGRADAREVEATLDAGGRVHFRMIEARRGSGSSGIAPRPRADALLEIPHPRLSPFLVHEESFVQPHARALFLYHGVVEEAIAGFLAEESARLPDVVEAWDLYCGSGAFSFLPCFLGQGHRAGKSFRITAVEGVERAIESCRRNAAAGGPRFSPGALAGFEAVRDDVRRFVSRNARRIAPIVLLDPPRDGVGPETLASLAAPTPRPHGREKRADDGAVYPPALMIYVACDSASLARDLVPALAAGYALEALHLFDTFAQTAHFESLAVLRRR